MSGVQDEADHAALAMIVAEECVGSQSERHELDIGRRIGARDDRHAVEIFCEVFLEPLGQYVCEEVSANDQASVDTEDIQSPVVKAEDALPEGTESLSVVERFELIENLLDQRLTEDEVADEMSISPAAVSELLVLRLVPERMRSRVNHSFHEERSNSSWRRRSSLGSSPLLIAPGNWQLMGSYRRLHTPG